MIFDRWGKRDIVLSSTLYLNYEFRSLGKAGYCSVLHTVLGNYEIRLKWAEFKLRECSIILY